MCILHVFVLELNDDCKIIKDNTSVIIETFLFATVVMEWIGGNSVYLRKVGSLEDAKYY